MFESPLLPVSPAARDRVIQIVNEVVGKEMGKFLSVRPVTGNLTFEVAGSRYERALRTKGWSVSPSCAVDCVYAPQGSNPRIPACKSNC